MQMPCRKKLSLRLQPPPALLGVILAAMRRPGSGGSSEMLERTSASVSSGGRGPRRHGGRRTWGRREADSMTKCCERVITFEQMEKLFSDVPRLLFVRPFPVAAPLSAIEDFLDSVRGQDPSKTHELTQEFLRRWRIPPESSNLRKA